MEFFKKFFVKEPAKAIADYENGFPEKEVIEAKIRRIQELMAGMEPDDDGFDKLATTLNTLNEVYDRGLSRSINLSNAAIEQQDALASTRCRKWDTVAKIGGVVGTIGLTYLGLKVSYRMDSGEEIVRNKLTQRLTDKLFPPRLL